VGLGSLVTLALKKSLIDEIIAHAREAAPQECCGLIGASGDNQAQTLYRARNIAPNPMVAYEAAPEDLFAAQRNMRERNEQLFAIYHSHPNASDPQPSATDVRLAYYPTAVYLIVGLGSLEPRLKAFRISEREDCWKSVELQVIPDARVKLNQQRFRKEF
jgi:proteasome lid subunit RPN8/RPN11